MLLLIKVKSGFHKIKSVDFKKKSRAKYHQFEAFIIRVSKSQELVKTIFSRRILRFVMLLIWQFIIYQIYLNPSHQLETINCPLPSDLYQKDSSGRHVQTVKAVISSTSLRCKTNFILSSQTIFRTSIMVTYFIVNTVVLITLPFCWCIR